jgi:putative nucleotidyltransferase with HDIG domain
LKQTLLESVSAVAAMVEMRDPYTAGHQQRVSQIAEAIAREMQLPQQQIEGIVLAAVIHDVGKISIPTEFLSKPGNLNDVEYSLIQEHPKSGFEILKGIDYPWPIATIVLQHHERIDGTGYPYGLQGDDILLEARIIAVADVIEAMASHRPYRPSLGIDTALEEIEVNSGVKYDAEAAGCALRLFRDQGFELIDVRYSLPD